MLRRVLASVQESVIMGTGVVDSWEEVARLRDEAGKCCLRGDDFGAAFNDQQASKMAERIRNQPIG